MLYFGCKSRAWWWSNKAKAAGTWQQSNDPGTNRSEGSSAPHCSGEAIAIVRNRQVVAERTAENRTCSLLTRPGQTQHSWGETKSLFRFLSRVYMLTLYRPSTPVCSLSMLLSEETGCKSVGARVGGELVPQHVLRSESWRLARSCICSIPFKQHLSLP